MALQTQTSMSSTSTATSTATSSSSTATSTGTSGGNTGFFTPNSSTPLVLAFLGVGLVAAGVILFLGWRRSQLARIWADNFQSRQSLRKDVDGSPKLWDLWTTKGNTGVGSGVGVGPGYGADAGTGTAHAGGSSSALVQSAAIVDHHQWAKDMAWESVMPISATPVIRESHNDNDDENNEPAAGDVPSISLMSRLSAFRNRAVNELQSLIHLYRRHPLQIQAEARRREGDIAGIGSPNAATQTGDVLKGTQPEDMDLKELRGYEGFEVAMAIAMPKPKPEPEPNPREGDDIAEEGKEIYQYSIGICRVTWEMETLSTDTNR